MNDYPIVNDGDPGHILIPLEHEDVRIASALPDSIKRELARYVRDCIRALGKEHGTTEPRTNSAIC